MTPRLTPADIDTREDSARDLAQTEAANRMDAERGWDGYDDRLRDFDAEDFA